MQRLDAADVVEQLQLVLPPVAVHDAQVLQPGRHPQPYLTVARGTLHLLRTQVGLEGEPLALLGGNLLRGDAQQRALPLAVVGLHLLPRREVIGEMFNTHHLKVLSLSQQRT